MLLDKKILVLKEHNHYYYKGCHKDYLRKCYVWEDKLQVPSPYIYIDNAVCFKVSAQYKEDIVDTLQFETSYYIGLQYVKEWKIPVLVEPKVNNDFSRLDFLGMLTEALTEAENFNHLEGLMSVDYNAEWIEIPSKNNIELTPFLVIQFLMAVKQIVQKGLKKSYYKKTENLKNRVKGKILIGQQIKHNVFKNKLNNTVCHYEVFGYDTLENQFIKYVLQEIYSYVELFESDLKKQLIDLLRFNLAPFYQVSDKKFRSFDKKEKNPFYKIYNNAFELGNQILILKDQSYSNASEQTKKYPPHWIDMSKLFELFVYKKLREKFTGNEEVQYHTKANYQELDFIINSGEFKAVVDAKYKPRYENGNPTKEDARQLSGYSRLSKIYEILNIKDDRIIPVYFIYPKNLNPITVSSNEETEETEEIQSTTPDYCILDNNSRVVKAYKKMFMQEVSLKVLPNL